MKKNSQRAGLAVSWRLPETVVWEREYQMSEPVTDLVRSVGRLNKLGNKLEITEDRAKQRIHEIVKETLEQHHIEVLPVDCTRVDLHRMMSNSAFREAPFERRGDKGEKGFRDAQIIEAFYQLVADSPRSPDECQIALLSGDGRLRDGAKIRTADSKNVHIFESPEQLQSLIDNLVSPSIDEAYLAELQKKAAAYFIGTGQAEGLFSREKITEAVEAKYMAKLSEVPHGAAFRVNKGWVIGATWFEKKEKDRTFWITRVKRRAQAYSKGWATPPMTWKAPLADDRAGVDMSEPEKIFIGSTGEITLPDLLGLGGPTRLTMIGMAIFEVHWNVAVDQHKDDLKDPKVERTEYADTRWDYVGP